MINNTFSISIEKNGFNVVEILDFLIEIDQDFFPHLSKKVDLPAYAEKLNSRAVFFIAKVQGEIAGMLTLYANDNVNKESFLPLLGVKKKFRGKGIAQYLLNEAIDFLKNLGFLKVSLETWEGSVAQILYQRNNFIISSIISDREENLKSVNMFRWLGEIGCEKSSYYSTQLDFHLTLSEELSINLFIKRDDLYPKFGGGNKARKLDYILNHAKKEGFNSLVTTGAAESNHCRVSALHAASLGWQSIIIIHDKEPEFYGGNLKLMKLAGAEIRFVDQVEVKEAMNQAISDLKERGFNPYYIWGGGHSVEGSLAYFEAVKELKSQLGNIQPDFIVVASGTGTTQAGIEIGIRTFFPDCEVIGISVAREENRGKKEILKSMLELNEYLGKPILMPQDIFFNTSICGDGYGKIFPELLETVQESLEKGFIIDPTYSGKAFFAMKKLVQIERISKGKNVIFWHTGGLFNLMNSSVI